MNCLRRSDLSSRQNRRCQTKENKMMKIVFLPDSAPWFFLLTPLARLAHGTAAIAILWVNPSVHPFSFIFVFSFSALIVGVPNAPYPPGGQGRDLAIWGRAETENAAAAGDAAPTQMAKACWPSGFGHLGPAILIHPFASVIAKACSQGVEDSLWVANKSSQSYFSSLPVRAGRRFEGSLLLRIRGQCNLGS